MTEDVFKGMSWTTVFLSRIERTFEVHVHDRFIQLTSSENLFTLSFTLLKYVEIHIQFSKFFTGFQRNYILELISFISDFYIMMVLLYGLTCNRPV